MGGFLEVNMPNPIGKKFGEENRTATGVSVGQDPVLNERFLKPDEFAEYLGIPLRWIYRHIKNIPHHRVGKYLRFDLESPALRHWIQSLERRPQQ
jgi:excisionase family DNA binding protein